MVLSPRQYGALAGLLFYWLLLFYLTHIPIPRVARQSGMSDKMMHVLAYMVLVVLWWLLISPGRKVNWLKMRVWITLAVMVWYGAVDEYSQGRMGRTTDVMDFVSDLAGATGGLLILTVFEIPAAVLILGGAFIFSINNLSGIENLYPQYHLKWWFHFAGYAIFTLVWAWRIKGFRWCSVSVRWFLAVVGMPAGLLVFVKATSLMFGRHIHWLDILTAGAGIMLAWAVNVIACRAWESIGTARQDL